MIFYFLSLLGRSRQRRHCVKRFAVREFDKWLRNAVRRMLKREGPAEDLHDTFEGSPEVPKFAANLSMMFNEVPFLERFGAAADSGFTAVEYLFPYEFQGKVLAEQLRKHNLENVLFNLPPGNSVAGERGRRGQGFERGSLLL